MKRKLSTRNIAHPKYHKRIELYYKRGDISEENYEYLLFQKEIFDEVGGSLESWQYLTKEVMDKYGEMNMENLKKVIEEWAV